MTRLSPPSRTAVGVAAFVALAALHGTVEQAADRAAGREPLLRLEEAIYLPPAPALKALALGRRTFVADILWLRALSYFALHFQGDQEYRWLDPLIAAILDLDPDYRKVYHWAAVVVMYGRRIDNASVLASNRLLEAALDRFPDDWEFHFLLGCNLTFELRSPDRAETRLWRERGAEHIRIASTLQDAPAWLPLTAAGLQTRLGHEELAIRHLEEVYLHTENADLKEELGAVIAKRRSAHEVARLSADRERFVAAWKGSYPYLPPDLFAHLGERMDRRVILP